eukprot:11179231-Lingulodinium_polyedra.AAC.1
MGRLCGPIAKNCNAPVWVKWFWGATTHSNPRRLQTVKRKKHQNFATAPNYTPARANYHTHTTPWFPKH